MKYIKKFESDNTFKKYLIIIAANRNGYLLFENKDNNDRNNIELKFLYRIHKGVIISLNYDNIFFKDDIIKKRLIFESDNFEDAYEYLESILNSFKYNL